MARDFANKQKIQRQIDIVSGVRVLGPRASVTSGDEAAPDNSFTAATITGAGGLGDWTVDSGHSADKLGAGLQLIVDKTLATVTDIYHAMYPKIMTHLSNNGKKRFIT